MPHPALQSAFDALYPPGHQWYWRADFVNEIPDEAVELHAEFGAELPTCSRPCTCTRSTAPPTTSAPARHGVELPRRDAGAPVIVGVDPDPANAGRDRRLDRDYWEALHPYSAGGAYVNMMMDEGQERVRASYRDNYDRLARIKATYDPANLFRVNQNIEPQS